MEFSWENLEVITPEIQEIKTTTGYREHPAWSQSDLKGLGDPQGFFNKKKKKSKAHFTLGSTVDTLLTEPELFNERFVVLNGKSPTQGLLVLTEWLIENELDCTKENVLEAQKATNFNLNWGAEAVMKHFNQDCFYYFKTITENKTKKVIDLKTYETAVQIVNSLKTNKYTNFYCLSKDDMKSAYEHIEIFHQVELYFKKTVFCTATDEDVVIECKACLDRVHVNHKDGTVTPIDYKTTGKPTFMFSNSVKDFRYDVQGASYSWGLKEYTKGRATSNVEMNCYGYDILNFLFVVETTDVERIGSPMVYELSANDIQCGLYGLNYSKTTLPAVYNEVLTTQTKGVPGWLAYLELCAWHTATKVENYRKNDYQQLEVNGKVATNAW